MQLQIVAATWRIKTKSDAYKYLTVRVIDHQSIAELISK